MSGKARREYLAIIRQRYATASKRHKHLILDEFCQVCCYNRKYAIRLLNAPESMSTSSRRHRSGAKPKYRDEALVRFIKVLWRASNLACGKRLKAMIADWLPAYEQYHDIQLSSHIRRLLTSISAATIDRLLCSERATGTKLGLATTKPGSLLKKHIPISTSQWDQTKPGFLEADTVAHCGTSMAGMFVFTVNTVDIATCWTEQRAVWGKGEQGVLNAVKSIEDALPFPVLGFDCDNGSEFLNWHLMKHLTERPRPIQYTRSREYQKNDNAHIEEKNWTHIRQYLGYERFDDVSMVAQLNALFMGPWRLFFNFFLPSVKLIEKRREGSKTIKHHDAPKTPYRRVLDSQHVSDEVKQNLKALRASLSPFELQHQIQSSIKCILSQSRTTAQRQSRILAGTPHQESTTP